MLPFFFYLVYYKLVSVCFTTLVLRNYGKKKTSYLGSRGYLIETEKMGFVEPEEDKNQETLLLLWCGDEGCLLA
jgi:hypothetical protein